jgi:hypothetical protein
MQATLVAGRSTPTAVETRIRRKEHTTCGTTSAQVLIRILSYAHPAQVPYYVLLTYPHTLLPSSCPGIDIVPLIFYSANYYTSRAVKVSGLLV